MLNMNINNTNNGTAGLGGGAGELEPLQTSASVGGAGNGASGGAASGNTGNPPGSSVGSSAAAAILQNNGLRKSMQGSTAGLRSLQTTMSTSNQLQHQQAQHQQQNQERGQYGQNPQGRSSHSHSSQPHGGHLGPPGSHLGSSAAHQAPQLGHQPHQQTYHSVAAQSRGQPQQLGIFGPGPEKGPSNGASVSGNYGGPVGSGGGLAVSGMGGLAPGGTAPPLKYQNGIAGGAPGSGPGADSIMNHKQFSMSTQHGLFPKITNLRIENQSVPNSAHSVGHGPSAGAGQITSAAAINVLKNSGGHISGMSNHHQTHHHNLNPHAAANDRHHFRGLGGSAGMGAPLASGSHPVGLSATGSHPLKPLSSPRSSHQRPGHAAHDGAPAANPNDPNLVYQQQLLWKTKSSMNASNTEDPHSSKSNSGAQATESSNPPSGNTQQQLFSSPGPGTGGAVQLHFEQQRAKQISSGSEKRLKLHQQRQYYSEQYRAQQQRQHQQTANAVLSQGGPAAANSSQSAAQTQPGSSSQSHSEQIANQRPGAACEYPGSATVGVSHPGQTSNYRLGGGAPGPTVGVPGVPLRPAEYGADDADRADKIHSSQQAQAQASQAMTPQIYSQQRQRHHQAGMMTSGGTMHHTTQMINAQIPMNGSIIAPSGSVALSQQHQKQYPLQQPPLSTTMNSSQTYQQANAQVFFKKRASSNTNSQPQNVISSPTKPDQSHQLQNQQPDSRHSSGPVASQPQTTQQQPLSSSQIQSGGPPQRHDGAATATSPKNLSQPHGQSTSQTTQGSSSNAGQSSASQQANGQSATAAGAQQQPKIPVICGFHKRILLITCQGSNGNGAAGQMLNGPAGAAGLGGINPNSSMSQARRIRNKNPNCNHNSNSVFYQPHYNNVKYDDSHKKKEDVLRKVFFKECAKEEEKRLYNGSTMYPNGAFPGATPGGPPGPNGHMYAGSSEMARQQAFSQANDPNKHLQIIERILCEYLFVPQPFDRSQKTQLSNTQSLMMELGLDRALTPHRAFLLALIRAGKFNADNMLKVLSEVKTSATEFDNECIYCKYSQYALKESAKLLQKHQAALQEQSQTNPQQALAQQQQIQQNGGIIKGPSGEDIRIENLVRMFQSQLFKKSFINTSLMIIQRKMTEKYFQKYHNAKQAQQANANGQDPTRTGPGATAAAGGVQYGPDGKPIDQPRRPAKKAKPKNQQNLSSLEYLSKEIQKLSKNLANPKDKERYLELKEKYYREFLVKVLKSNGVEKIQFPTASFTPYKYYIGRGNNSGIVRTALKSRFWWSMGDYDDWEDYNFIWTQWKSNKILGCIKSHRETQEMDAKDQDKKRSSQSTRGGHIDSQLSTQATDKESTSSKENLITTPKKNKLASTSLGNTSSELQFKKQQSATANNSATKTSKIVGRGKKTEEKEEEKEENVTSHSSIAYSKMENNYHLSNKKAIYYNMKVYYEAIGLEYHRHLPLTFHIKEGLNDPQFLKFESIFHDAQDGTKETILDGTPKLGKSLWIVKPGENTNRGCGIQVSKDLDHIKGLIQNTNIGGNRRSYIIQKYIEKPLLYKNRKFDIRCFTMMCCINGNLQGYWYSEGYFRTSCREFTLKNVSNRYVHLTNDAVQKKLDDYGKFESGNKLSYSEFQKYLDSQSIKCDFAKDVVPKMKGMAQDSMRAVSRKLDPSRKSFSFEIFGYDFMIDEDMNVWVIEVNTNPCFELSSPYLARLIPAMVENALKIAVDPLFPPPPVPNSKRHSIPDAIENKFDIIFNEREDAQELKHLPIDDNMNGIIEEDEMEEEGSDLEDENDENEE